MFTYNLNKYNTSKVAKFRLRVIKFHNRFGTKAALAAFPVSRSTIFLWKKKFREGGFSSLIPQSTRPQRLRQSRVDKRIINEIERLRQTNYCPGKAKLKPMIDKFCQKNSLQTVSQSTIGRILKRNNYFHTKQGELRHSYHTATGKWQRRKKWKKKRLRVKYHPRPKSFGYIQMDTIVKFTDGIKRYIITAIDVKLKFSFALMYPRLNSRNSKDFFKKLEQVYPLTIKTIQTDNGLEFLGEFNQYLEESNIKHLFIYPRCPRINGTVERFNRTIQAEFIDPNIGLIHSDEFNQSMIEYLLYYNTKRPHESLDQVSPIQYLIDNKLKSNKWWTCTKT